MPIHLWHSSVASTMDAFSEFCIAKYARDVQDPVPFVAQILMDFRGDGHFREAGPYVHLTAMIEEAYEPAIQSGPQGQRRKGVMEFMNSFSQLEMFR